MKTIKWTGKAGNEIELRAFCKIEMAEKEIDSDGHVLKHGMEPRTEANLELWVDGKKIDSCRYIGSWTLIDIPGQPGIKKIHGLKIGMSLEQAEKVEEFLKSVIEDGKTTEVKAYEAAKEEKMRQMRIEDAEMIIKAAEKTRRNDDGSLMTNEQARAWRKRYNDLYNEGGEGYVPNIITQESYEWARSIVGK